MNDQERYGAVRLEVSIAITRRLACQNHLLMTACEPGAQPLEERGIPAAVQLRFLIRPAQPVSWGGAGIEETAS